MLIGTLQGLGCACTDTFLLAVFIGFKQDFLDKKHRGYAIISMAAIHNI